MIPGKYNMVCPQGSTFIKELIYGTCDAPINITGYSARMQIRETHASTSYIASLSTTGLTPAIVLDGLNGKITLTISATITASFYPKEYVYDLEIVSGSNVVTRIIEGKFIVTPEVTR